VKFITRCFYNFFLVSLLLFSTCISAFQSIEEESFPVKHSVDLCSGQYSETTYDLVEPYDFGVFRLSRHYGNTTADRHKPSWHFNVPQLLGEDFEQQDPKFIYRYDKLGRLEAIYPSVSWEALQSTALIFFSYSSTVDGREQCQAVTASGKTITYIYTLWKKDGKTIPLIDSVTLNDGSSIAYIYQKINDHPVISGMSNSKAEGMAYTYDENDTFPHINSAIWQSPATGERKLLATFKYERGRSSMTNDKGATRSYCYSAAHILRSIDTYLPNQDQLQDLYRQEVFLWNSNAEGALQIICHATADHNQQLIAYKTYDYNDKGNLIDRSFYGDIIGKKIGDKHSEHWHYSPEGLLKEWYDVAGRKWEYRYRQTDNKLIEKTCKSHGLERRYTFDYDDSGRLIHTAIDDGTAEGASRHAFLSYKTLENTTDQPSTVHEVIEASNGEKNSLRYIFNEYDALGSVREQSQYSDSDQAVLLQKITYDSHRRPIEILEPSGDVTTYSYTENGSIASETHYSAIGTMAQKHYIYDASGRVIHQATLSDNGITTETRYRYSPEGLLLAKGDLGGNETIYQYDALDRLIQISHPPILSSRDTVITPKETFIYDLQDRLITAIDCNGGETHYTYTLWNKPQTIYYPDGSCESYLYSNDGLCTEKSQRDGTQHRYIYDALGNMIREEHWAGDLLLTTTSHTYNAWQRISTTDPRGKVTHYALDGSVSQMCGELTWTLSTDPTSKTITLQQDNLDSSPGFYIIPTAGRAVEYRDASGELLQLIHLPERENLHIAMSPQYNVLGQIIAHYTFCDKNGMRTNLYLNAIGRPERMEKFDDWGTILSRVEWRYDACGNKLQEEHWLNASEEGSPRYKISWQWGPGQQMISLCEGDDTLHKTTRYAYNCRGLLERLTNPDGIEILYEYDTAARLIKSRSSDGIIDYTYSYNSLGQCINAIDMNSSYTVRRRYSEHGSIAWERQGDIELSNTYDALGRRTSLTLSDGSEIRYEYSGIALRAIHRIGNDGTLLYSQRYTRYDVTGQPLEIMLPGNSGTIQYTYDDKGRCLGINSANWHENIAEEHMDSRGRPLQINRSDSAGSCQNNYGYSPQGELIEENATSLSYDALGNRHSSWRGCNRFNGLQQLVQQGNRTFTYDDNGNLSKIIEGDSITELRYDPLGHLTFVNLSNSAYYHYGYDALGRRITTSSYGMFGELLNRTHYVYDDQEELCTWDRNTATSLLRIPSDGVAAPAGAAIAIERGGQLFVPICDRLGNIGALLNAATGVIEQSYRYSAFGEKSVYDGAGILLDEALALIPWGFAGKRLDRETGFIYFGQRFYSPAIGRWITPDPLGYCDGPNRYLFVHNDPCGLIDPTGTTARDALYDKIFRPLQILADHIAEMYQRSIELGGVNLYGSLYRRLDGETGNLPESGVFGQGEANPLIRVTMINGLFNEAEDARKSIAMVSELHGGVNIHYIFRHTMGVGKDLLSGILGKLGYISPHARQLATTWKQLIVDMGGVSSGGVIYHYAHSMGAADTYTAEQLMTSEELRMIHVVTFGSPSRIFPGGFGEVTNVMSVRDGILWLDPINHIDGIFETDSNMLYKGSWIGAPFVDHWLSTDSYRNVLIELGGEFIRKYLNVPLAA
jgi:RHS repeat-associated protein